MGGKSTLLRSTCVAVVMAQIGCYVSGSSAVLAPVDAIFTRIGEHAGQHVRKQHETSNSWPSRQPPLLRCLAEGAWLTA